MSGLDQAGDFVFNCQMGRGRTTTGMVSACLIATVMTWDQHHRGTDEAEDGNESPPEEYDAIDGPSEEEAHLQGECHLLPYAEAKEAFLTTAVT